MEIWVQDHHHLALEIPTILLQPLDKSKTQDLVLQQVTLDLDWDQQDLVVLKILLDLTLDQLIPQTYSVRNYLSTMMD